MRRKKISRRAYRKSFKKNFKFHKKNLPGTAMTLRSGRRLPL